MNIGEEDFQDSILQSLKFMLKEARIKDTEFAELMWKQMIKLQKAYMKDPS